MAKRESRWESSSHRIIEVGVNGGRNDQSEARVGPGEQCRRYSATDRASVAQRSKEDLT